MVWTAWKDIPRCVTAHGHLVSLVEPKNERWYGTYATLNLFELEYWHRVFQETALARKLVLCTESRAVA